MVHLKLYELSHLCIPVAPKKWVWQVETVTRKLKWFSKGETYFFSDHYFQSLVQTLSVRFHIIPIALLQWRTLDKGCWSSNSDSQLY